MQAKCISSHLDLLRGAIFLVRRVLLMLRKNPGCRMRLFVITSSSVCRMMKIGIRKVNGNSLKKGSAGLTQIKSSISVVSCAI